jgi:hypothetical protein
MDNVQNVDSYRTNVFTLSGCQSLCTCFTSSNTLDENKCTENTSFCSARQATHCRTPSLIIRCLKTDIRVKSCFRFRNRKLSQGASLNLIDIPIIQSHSSLGQQLDRFTWPAYRSTAALPWRCMTPAVNVAHSFSLIVPLHLWSTDIRSYYCHLCYGV